ncbi:DUF4121 family protein [Anaerovorax sp. IOR16]|uniref:DUF4121 family protein n=1 Tax=Anaerovorax sp. IOR16 TaxID=2773458 RepID=UPI0019CF5CF1|nr:DUF4121 family protein [Anaerovorax sp. IOR16]
MYTIETLKEINLSYDYQHRVTQSDIEKANMYVKIIEESRTDNQIQVGDIIEFTNKHGDYYRNAHVESLDRFEEDSCYICEQPYIPFIGLKDDKRNIYCSTSGGAWCNIPNNLKLFGKRLKTFKDWGHCGGCANGAFNFHALVNVWEYKEPNSLYGEYSTKDYVKQYISYNPDAPKQKSMCEPYIYFADGHAWVSKEELNAYLETYRAKIFKGNWENQTVAFLYKEREYLITREEWDGLDLPVDTRMCNGIIFVKVKYDDENHCIDTYRYTNDGSENWKTHKPYELIRKQMCK